jgi:hypothetical protein
MKNLVRTYVDPILEDRLKLLAESSGISLSALTAELIQKGLESNFNQSHHSGEPPIWMEESFYLQYLTLQVVLNSGSFQTEKFEEIKSQARQWAKQKSESFTSSNKGE